MDNVRREDAIVGGLAVLLIIVLVAFPWFSIGVGPFSFTLTATDAPDGWLGVLALIALIALIADLGSSSSRHKLRSRPSRTAAK